MTSPYVLRRLAQALVVLWGAVTFSFAIIHLVPGDPVSIMLGGGQGGDGAASASPEQVEALRTDLGLDQPLPLQYLDFIRRLLVFDFGTSYSTGQQVSQAVGQALPVTIELGIASIVLTIVLALIFAVLGVVLPTRPLRSAFQSTTVLGLAMPSFWLGIVLLQVFSFTLGWFPAYGGGSLRALVLPALTVALGTAAVMGQVLVRGLQQALAEPYADTARAKGVGHLRVVLVHALRNASVPVFTMVGMLVGGIMSGAVIVETVYGRQGIGLLFVEAIRAKDFPVIQVLIILSGGLFVLVTLLVDLSYRAIDPRVLYPHHRRAS